MDDDIDITCDGQERVITARMRYRADVYVATCLVGCPTA
jgi:hypothetical protein